MFPSSPRNAVRDRATRPLALAVAAFMFFLAPMGARAWNAPAANAWNAPAANAWNARAANTWSARAAAPALSARPHLSRRQDFSGPEVAIGTDSVQVRRLRQLADEVAAPTEDTSPAALWNVETPAARASRERREDGWTRALARLDSNTFIAGPSWPLYTSVREALASARAVRVCHGEWWDVDQLNGWQARIGFAAATQPAGTPARRKALLDRFAAIPDVADLETSELREGVRHGFTAPVSIVDRVVAQLDALLADRSPASAALFAPARQDTSTAFRAEWDSLLTRRVYPALQAHRDFLADWYHAHARQSVSLASLPNGKTCYRAQLRAQTTLDVNLDSTFVQAARAARAVHQRLAPLLARVTHSTDVVSGELAMRSDRDMVIVDPDSVLAAYRAQLDRARAPLSKWFVQVPDSAIVVVAVPAAQAPSAAPARYQPPSDGGAATLFVNAFQPGGVPRMNIADATAHEAYPGHHFQWLVARAAEDPRVGRIGNNSGFTEGWAIYAEALADEMGAYTSDLDQIGYLIHLDDVYTALRLDIAIHAYGWSRDQAITAMMESAGRTRAQAESYADRHATDPGQLATYGLGFLEITRLRAKAQQRLGSRFNIKEFHQQILDDGTIPLPMVRARVERWIAGLVHK